MQPTYLRFGLVLGVVALFSALMDSRKRPYSDEEDSVSAKKRVVTGSNGSPQVNGHSEHEEPTENDNLEVRRVQ